MSDTDSLDDYLDDVLLEQVMAQPADAAPAEPRSGADAHADNTQTPAAAVDFAAVLQQTQRKIRQSQTAAETGAGAGAADDPDADDHDLLTDLLASLDLGSIDGLNGDEGDLATMLTDALAKLTTKDMLYDTIAQSCDKYEEYFASHAKPADAQGLSDHLRYEAQFAHLKTIRDIFEAAEYADGDEAQRKRIDEEMEKFNNLAPGPEGVLDDDLKGLGVGFGDDDVPFDVDGCQQQ